MIFYTIVIYTDEKWVCYYVALQLFKSKRRVIELLDVAFEWILNAKWMRQYWAACEQEKRHSQRCRAHTHTRSIHVREPWARCSNNNKIIRLNIITKRKWAWTQLTPTSATDRRRRRLFTKYKTELCILYKASSTTTHTHMNVCVCGKRFPENRTTWAEVKV